MTACSALLTAFCICPAVYPPRSRNSKRGTARVVPITFSSAVPNPPIWPSMRPSSVVSLSGDEPLVMLVIQSSTVRQSLSLVSVFSRHHPILSMCEFGSGAATVPPQNCGSSLQSCQSNIDIKLGNLLLNVVLVIFITSKNFQEVVKRTGAWKSRLYLSVERDEFGPGHNRNRKLRTR